MHYRASNKFGGIVRATIIAHTDTYTGEVLKIISLSNYQLKITTGASIRLCLMLYKTCSYES